MYMNKLIKEQFNINNMDFNNKKKHNVNIFNKNIMDPKKIYNNFLETTSLSEDELQFLNNITSEIKITEFDELKKIVNFYIKNCPDGSLNWIDVSDITEMTSLFVYYTPNNERININFDISEWDVSNVKDMSYMFHNSTFNGDISRWDVSNVTIMEGMFKQTQFTRDISNWNVSNVKTMSLMFNGSHFNGDISKWDVSHVENMYNMFSRSYFNGDISKWNVSSVTNMMGMFEFSIFFNQNLSMWNVSNVSNMAFMFNNSKFNNDISGWDVSNVTYYNGIFIDCPIKEEYKPKKFRRQL